MDKRGLDLADRMANRRNRFRRQESYVKKHNTPGIGMPGVL
jgi:hypothetical protein